MEFTFMLNYQLSGADGNQDELVERLGAGGCDDALIGTGAPGRIALEFTREANSAFEALCSALTDVRQVIPSAKLIEAGPDLVGLTDIADAVGVTRQNMRKLAVNNFATFPVPVHAGSLSLWHLVDVLHWMRRKAAYNIAPGVLEVAEAAKQINLVKGAKQIQPATADLMQALFV